MTQYSSRQLHLEDGPKNPFKGTSMKSLVVAFNAQSGVAAGG